MPELNFEDQNIHFGFPFNLWTQNAVLMHSSGKIKRFTGC